MDMLYFKEMYKTERFYMTISELSVFSQHMFKKETADVLLSIIIPVYNREKSVKDTLNWLKKQHMI